MIWADRVGIVWALFIAALILVVNEPHNTNGTVVFWVIAAPWLAMRALDWIFSGEIRRTSSLR